MNELRVDIGGSSRGFQIATEQTKRLAAEMNRSLEQSTPQNFKGAQMMREQYGTMFDGIAAHSEGTFGKLKEGLGELREHLSGMAAQMAVAFVGEEAIRRTVEFGEQVSNLSRQTGTSTDTVQKWGYALQQSGSNMAALGPFFSKLAATRDAALGGGPGSGKALAAFKELGVAVDELKSKRLEDIGMQIAETFKAGDAQQLIGALREVGGRGATELVSAFKNGMRELTDEAVAAGVVMDKATIGKLAEGGEKLKQIGAQLMAGFAPIIGLLAEGVEKVYNGWARIARMAGGFSVGGFKEAIKSGLDFDKEVKARDDAAKNRAKGSSAGAGEDAGETLLKGLARAHAEYRRELESTVDEKSKLTMLMSDERDLKAAIAKAEAAHDEVEALKLKTELLRVQHGIADTTNHMNETAYKNAKAQDKAEHKGLHMANHIDSMSSTGLFQSISAASSNPMLEIARHQLKQLSTIAKNTTPKQGQSPHAQ